MIVTKEEVLSAISAIAKIGSICEGIPFNTGCTIQCVASGFIEALLKTNQSNYRTADLDSMFATEFCKNNVKSYDISRGTFVLSRSVNGIVANKEYFCTEADKADPESKGEIWFKWAITVACLSDEDYYKQLIEFVCSLQQKSQIR